MKRSEDRDWHLPQDEVGGTGGGAPQAAGGSGAVVEQTQQLRQLRGSSSAVRAQRTPGAAAATVEQLVLDGREDRRGRRHGGRQASAERVVRPWRIR